MTPTKGDRTVTTCRICGEDQECEYGPDPFAEEIGHDSTPYWECDSCRYQSAQDI